jgi:hypothetical protein
MVTALDGAQNPAHVAHKDVHNQMYPEDATQMRASTSDANRHRRKALKKVSTARDKQGKAYHRDEAPYAGGYTADNDNRLDHTTVQPVPPDESTFGGESDPLTLC